MKRRPEFPELLACTGMPSLDGQTVELRVVNEGEPPGPDFTVSIDDIVWVNMPPPPRPEQIDTPEKAFISEATRSLFEHYGLALVACRVIERQAGYWIVEVPDIRGAKRITVKPENLARPHRPNT